MQRFHQHHHHHVDDELGPARHGYGFGFVCGARGVAVFRLLQFQITPVSDYFLKCKPGFFKRGFVGCLILTGSNMSADPKIAELLTELHQLIKQTQVSTELWGDLWGGFGDVTITAAVPFQEERSRSEHNLLNIQKTHERMQTENKSELSTWKLELCVFAANVDLLLPQRLRTTAPSSGGCTPPPKLTPRPSAGEGPAGGGTDPLRDAVAAVA